jgi:hypothetical protein
MNGYLVFHVEGRIQSGSVKEMSAEKNIWVKRGGTNRRLRIFANEELCNLYRSPDIGMIKLRRIL